MTAWSDDFKKNDALVNDLIIGGAADMGEQSDCIVTAIFSCLIYSFVTVSLNSGVMKDVLSFPATGKGGFFFNKTFKARRGTVCKLLRDPSNQHGNLIFISS